MWLGMVGASFLTGGRHGADLFMQGSSGVSHKASRQWGAGFPTMWGSLCSLGRLRWRYRVWCIGLVDVWYATGRRPGPVLVRDPPPPPGAKPPPPLGF